MLDPQPPSFDVTNSGSPSACGGDRQRLRRAGGGGAARRASGYRVTVLEKLDAPGGRAYVYRQDGFTFDAGPTIVTAPFLFEELWRLCGRKLSDDVDAGAGIAVLPHPLPGRLALRLLRRCRRDARGDRTILARRRRRLRALHEGQRGDLQGRLRTAWPRALQQVDRHGPDRAARWCGCRAIAASTAWSRSSFAIPRLRIAFSFHPLLIGGNPFTASSIYSLIAFLERRWGVHFAMGGTGRLVTGPGQADRGAGRRRPLQPEVGEIIVKDGAACGVRLASGRERRRRYRGLQRRFGLDLPPSAAGLGVGRAGPTGGSNERGIP